MSLSRAVQGYINLGYKSSRNSSKLHRLAASVPGRAAQVPTADSILYSLHFNIIFCDNTNDH
jgi:hypothetical protein